MDADPIYCCLCIERGVKREGIAVPVVEIPVLRWPVPAYMRFRGALCRQCAYGFTIDKFTDYQGAWYDLIGDHLRAQRKPAENPFPNDPSFKWESWIINPNYEPAPKDQCRVVFWKPETLAAKGAKKRLG